MGYTGQSDIGVLQNFEKDMKILAFLIKMEVRNLNSCIKVK